MLDKHKEITPVVYDDTAVRYLYMGTAVGGELCFPIHWHDRIEILKIISGSLELRLEGKSESVTAGQSVIIGPHMIHSGFSGPEGVSYHVLMFEPEHFRNTTKASEKYMDPIVRLDTTFRLITDHPAVNCEIDELIGLVSSGSANALLAVGTVYRILGLLYQHCDEDFIVMPQKDMTFRNVLEYLNSHYSEKLSAKDISEKFGYNESYFCRRFKNITGHTVMNYIFLLRMDAAHKLLQHTAEDIGTIARMCGFEDICYFSNCFKKYFGCPPTQFRNHL